MQHKLSLIDSSKSITKYISEHNSHELTVVNWDFKLDKSPTLRYGCGYGVSTYWYVIM